MNNNGINHEIIFSASNGAKAYFEFHAKDIEMASDHAKILLTDAREDINDTIWNFQWSYQPRGNVYGKYKKIATIEWMQII